MPIAFADQVIDYFSSGTGFIRGPYGGSSVGTGNPQDIRKVPLEYALGPEPSPATEVLTLPAGSYIDLGWSGLRGIVDGAGNDLFVTEWEDAGDTANVYVSADGSNFVLIGQALGGRETGFDLASIGMDNIQTVRILGNDLNGFSPGFDLVNIRANVIPLTAPPPQDPIARDDFYAGDLDTEITGNVIVGNTGTLVGGYPDLDQEGRPMTVIAGAFTASGGGTVTLAANGDFTYTPIAGFTGNETFTYTLLDDEANTDTAVVTFTISQCGRTLTGTAANELLFGTVCDDTLVGGGGNDKIEGGAGRDNLTGGGQVDIILGGAGRDRIDGGDGIAADILRGGGDHDVFLARGDGMVFDLVNGGDGVDRVRNIGGADLILGNAVALWAGVEVIEVGGHALRVFTNHSLDLSGLQVHDATAIIGTANNNTIIGTANDDIIDGGGGSDTLDGRGGNDTITGGGAGDTIRGGNGNDRIDGGTGNNSFNNFDTMEGGNGDDVFIGYGVDLVKDMLDGGKGIDTVLNTGGDDLFLGNAVADWKRIEFIDAAGHSIRVHTNHSLNLNGITLLNTVSILADGNNNTIIGTADDDIIDGGGGSDTLDGRGGNDTITGGGAGDTIRGGNGNDRIDGGTGNNSFNNFDTLNGGNGDDVFIGYGVDLVKDLLDGGKGIDTVLNTGGDDLFLGNAVADWKRIEFIDAAGHSIRVHTNHSLNLNGITLLNTVSILADGNNNTIVGTAADDIITDAGGTNAIRGRGGDDILTGGAGIDTIRGDAGRDTIDAGSGNDLIDGGARGDMLTGGAGSDTFVYSAVSDSTLGAGRTDRLSDFTVGADTLDLTAIDARTGAGNQSFDWIGQAVFSGAKGELRMSQIGGATGDDWFLEGDIDGDLTADLRIRLDNLGAATLFGEADIIL